jgi:pilus assembly protein Flp/PilA
MNGDARAIIGAGFPRRSRPALTDHAGVNFKISFALRGDCILRSTGKTLRRSPDKCGGPERPVIPISFGMLEGVPWAHRSSLATVRILFGGNGSMRNAMTRARQFLVSEDGPTATEYAVMLALIIIVALAGITLLGTKVNTIFTNVEAGLPDGS